MELDYSIYGLWDHGLTQGLIVDEEALYIDKIDIG